MPTVCARSSRPPTARAGCSNLREVAASAARALPGTRPDRRCRGAGVAGGRRRPARAPAGAARRDCATRCCRGAIDASDRRWLRSAMSSSSAVPVRRARIAAAFAGWLLRRHAGAAAVDAERARAGARSRARAPPLQAALPSPLRRYGVLEAAGHVPDLGDPTEGEIAELLGELTGPLACMSSRSTTRCASRDQRPDPGRTGRVGRRPAARPGRRRRRAAAARRVAHAVALEPAARA